MRLLGLIFASLFSMLALTVPAQGAPVCGNSVVESGEDCDDGNTDPGDCCSPTCQYESAATVCRPAAGVCDAPDNCDGASASCPPDEKLSITTVCRPAAQICDAPELCDGVSNDCPTRDLPANGFPCADGDLCNGDEICVGWVCVPGEPLVCDDELGCTVDSCDPELGCVFEPGQCVDNWLPSASPTGRLLLSLLLVAPGATFLARRGRFGA